MRVTVTPGIPQGTVRVPTSKSVAHRYLIAAAFTPGETRLRDLPDNADIRATLRCLRAMGAAIRQDGTGATICGRVPVGFPPDAVADCGESGTTLRLLLPFALLQPAGARMTFTGAPRLFARPLSVYEDICRAQGVLFARTEAGVTVGGGLHPDAFCFPGDISSQFVSGLLLALPHLRGDSSLRLTGQVGSASYIGLTLDALRLFGYTVGADGVQAYRIPGGQTGRAPEQTLCVPTDQSAAAFFGAMRTLGGDISLADFRDDGAQGDRVFGAYMERLCREKCRILPRSCWWWRRCTTAARCAIRRGSASRKATAARQWLPNCGGAACASRSGRTKSRWSRAYTHRTGHCARTMTTGSPCRWRFCCAAPGAASTARSASPKVCRNFLIRCGRWG